MQQPWSYEQNVFLNVTNHDYALMLTISEYHMNALENGSNIAEIKALRDRYKPAHDAYENQYSLWKNSGGTQKGETLTADQLLALITTRLNQWDPAIQMLYPKNTGGYKAIFPQGRRPFNTGSIDNRIAALKTMSDALKNIAPLSATYNEVFKFWDQLHIQRSSQQQSMNATGIGSAAVEAARVNAANIMYQNLGDLISFYYLERDMIGKYFDLKNIRHHDQVIFNGHVKGNVMHFIVKHTFGATDEITLLNKGITALHFGLYATKDAPFSEASGVHVAAGGSQTVSPDALGAAGNAYLMVYNHDANVQGEFEVDFL